MPKVQTFGLEENSVVWGEIVSGPTATGLFVIKIGEKKVVRHRDRLIPLDDDARDYLKRVTNA